jgi:hypothetical protein
MPVYVRLHLMMLQLVAHSTALSGAVAMTDPEGARAIKSRGQS